MHDQLPENDPGLERILISAEQLRGRIAELGAQIAADYAEHSSVNLIGVLKGAVVFLADLGRAIRNAGGPPLQYNFVRASTYGDSIKSPGETHRQTQIDGLPESIRDKDVILVEDILDQGFTLAAIRDAILRDSRARSVRICVLLDKKLDTPSDEVQAVRQTIRPDYTGFAIPDRWVAGYGLDVNEAYRELPCIAVVREHHFTGGGAA
jgi:hypoxanthine phosphoribosyltransferase